MEQDIRTLEVVDAFRKPLSLLTAATPIGGLSQEFLFADIDIKRHRNVFLILPPPTRLQNVVTHISNMLMT
jgi:hypothetical protein